MLQGAGITAVLVTHDREEALSFADQLVVLRDGQVRQVGAPREVYFRPVDAEAARFLGEVIILPATVGRGMAECALGRIAITDPDRSGIGAIVLRPEQVILTHVSPGDVVGSVRSVSFAGAGTVVEVALPDRNTQEVVVAIRGLHHDSPAVGATVGLRVVGCAHAIG